MSWITLVDEVRAIVRAVEDDQLDGPINLCAPGPVTNAEFTRALGAALRRPAALAVPRRVLDVLLGAEMAGEVLFSSQRAQPARLLAVGHTFAHPELETARWRRCSPRPPERDPPRRDAPPECRQPTPLMRADRTPRPPSGAGCLVRVWWPWWWPSPRTPTPRASRRARCGRRSCS